GDVVAAVLVDGADRQGAGEPGERAGARAGGDDVAQLGLAARHGAELLEGDGALAAVERALEERGGDVGGAARGRVAGGEHHALRGALERAGPGLRQVEAVGGAGEGLCGGQGLRQEDALPARADRRRHAAGGEALGAVGRLGAAYAQTAAGQAEQRSVAVGAQPSALARGADGPTRLRLLPAGAVPHVRLG